MGELTTGDLALMKDNDGFGGGTMGVFVLLLFLFALGGVGGNRGGMHGPGNFATQEQMTAGLNNVQTQNSLNQILLSSANNNYETAQLINGQTNTLMQQNNTNLMNAIQGFNAINTSIMNQTNVITQQLQALQAKMDNCCCEIKTQMLQDRLSDTQAALVTANNNISNANQSQYILGQLGRFVAWAGTGAPAATGTT